MKKYIFLLVATIILGFVVENKARADCPPGWDEATIIQPYIGDCRIKIIYCYKCGVTGAEPSNIKITFYGWDNPESPDCIGEIPFEIVWEAIRQSFFNKCQIPDCNTGNTLRVVVEYPICAKIINLGYTSIEIPCSFNYYCQFVMNICYSGNGQYQSSCEGWQTYGDPNSCLPQRPPLPPPGYESDCFIKYECKCP
ncbi:MAG: hypothetical protein WHV60_10500 [Bacteroidota bacterium]